jgi:hypothetical protein
MTEGNESSHIVLKRKWKADGHEGKLVADDTGIAIESSHVKRTKKKGFWSSSTSERITEQHYLARWADVTNIDITQPPTSNFAGSTLNSNRVDLVVDTTSQHLMFDLHSTNPGRVNNELGPYIAQVRNRHST